MTNDLSSRLQFAIEAIQSVTPGILEAFQRQDFEVNTKNDGSFVSEIDLKTETTLREMIQKAFPDDSIVGEEFGRVEGKTADCWYIDPIDGTKSFVSGRPLFGTQIGMERDGETVLGVVVLPAVDEMVYATKGGGTFWKPAGNQNLQKVSVSQKNEFSQSTFSRTSNEHFLESSYKEVYSELQKNFHTERDWGDCYGHLLVATGRIEAMFDVFCNDWDTVPTQIIIKEAGGEFCCLQGNETAHGKSMMSSNRNLYAGLTDILKRKGASPS